jgi:hypothetical protein
MDFLRRVFGGKLVAAGLLILLIPVSAISVISIFWQPEHEVLWHGSWLINNCNILQSQDGSKCIGQYELSVANTGDQPELVQIRWPLDLGHWSVDQKVLNLSADRKRLNDPDIACDWHAAEAKCSIKDFAAGTLLLITLRCLSCERAALEFLSSHPPTIISDAKVYESDPRGTLLFRRLFFFLSFF